MTKLFSRPHRSVPRNGGGPEKVSIETPHVQKSNDPEITNKLIEVTTNSRGTFDIQELAPSTRIRMLTCPNTTITTLLCGRSIPFNFQAQRLDIGHGSQLHRIEKRT